MPSSRRSSQRSSAIRWKRVVVLGVAIIPLWGFGLLAAMADEDGTLTPTFANACWLLLHEALRFPMVTLLLDLPRALLGDDAVPSPASSTIFIMSGVANPIFYGLVLERLWSQRSRAE